MTEIMFLWSDAWLLQAIAIASRQKGSACLSEVIEAADAVNHALPTRDELHGGLLRLTRGGFVKEVEQRFSLTDLVPAQIVATILAGERRRGRDAASALLRAESWSPKKRVEDRRNNVSYPGLTDQRIAAAEREYRRRVDSAKSN